VSCKPIFEGSQFDIQEVAVDFIPNNNIFI